MAIDPEVISPSIGKGSRAIKLWNKGMASNKFSWFHYPLTSCFHFEGVYYVLRYNFIS